MFVVAHSPRKSYSLGMMTHDDMVAELVRRLYTGELRSKQIADALRLPSSRVAEIRKGRRRIQPHEMSVVSDLLSGGAPSVASDFAPTIPAEDGVADVISLDLSVSMGPGTLVDGFVEGEPVKVDINVLRRLTRSPFEKLRVIKGDGSSMEPTLRTNDRVLVDTGETGLSRLHGIYWIDYEGAHGIKRLRPAGRGRIKIISDNEEVGDTFEVESEEIRIHGRALLFWRDL